jgi:O-acetyl-ADP-ribose deacetylase (regulator of RNase III)
MIKFVDGNLFDYKGDILINTVNVVGVMGKGIALEFKKRFPAMFRDYKEQCLNKELESGHIYPWHHNTGLIINFATKDHWKDPSKYEWIESGLKELKNYLDNLDFTCTVLIPALGCSNGGLDFDIVKVMINKYLSDSKQNIIVFNPNTERQK